MNSWTIFHCGRVIWGELPTSTLKSREKSLYGRGKSEKRRETHGPESREFKPQREGDLRFSDSPSGQAACGRARTHDRRVPADQADSLATVPQTSPQC
ncbi:hypothetical protein PoB_000244000 [Plakobranchus ocellatus]|uniref:Uncharacterized protein n=1 Tax=Plakobranchus ocellatus TaxID=259542 RepID=A0AAV3XYN5_9GAST|nr:hypothetical protein PoB_000244000 [Plakobranchus ocellatus]